MRLEGYEVDWKMKIEMKEFEIWVKVNIKKINVVKKI